MENDLTKRQRDILEFIKHELHTKGYPPSVREIGEAVGLSSSSTVHGHLIKLQEKGYLRRDPTKPRAIEVIGYTGQTAPKHMVNIPVVGKVTAGTPILASENIEDTFPLPLDFVEDKNVFILHVQGESMIDAGILDGDYVVVKQQNTADNGDIVVALIGDEATVKRFYKENDHYRLQPENQFMKPIIVREMRILGKVIGLLRKIN